MGIFLIKIPIILNIKMLMTRYKDRATVNLNFGLDFLIPGSITSIWRHVWLTEEHMDFDFTQGLVPAHWPLFTSSMTLGKLFNLSGSGYLILK